jgi:hypothetical protein
MQSEKINKLLESDDISNAVIALKILEKQITKANCIGIAYKIKGLQAKYNEDDINNLVDNVISKINDLTGFKLNRSISKSSKEIYTFLRKNETDDNSVNAFIKHYMEFVKYSITLDTNFDYIPPQNLNLFDND